MKAAWPVVHSHRTFTLPDGLQTMCPWAPVWAILDSSSTILRRPLVLWPTPHFKPLWPDTTNHEGARSDASAQRLSLLFEQLLSHGVP